MRIVCVRERVHVFGNHVNVVQACRFWLGGLMIVMVSTGPSGCKALAEQLVQRQTSTPATSSNPQHDDIDSGLNDAAGEGSQVGQRSVVSSLHLAPEQQSVLRRPGCLALFVRHNGDLLDLEPEDDGPDETEGETRAAVARSCASLRNR